MCMMFCNVQQLMRVSRSCMCSINLAYQPSSDKKKYPSYLAAYLSVLLLPKLARRVTQRTAHGASIGNVAVQHKIAVGCDV